MARRRRRMAERMRAGAWLLSGATLLVGALVVAGHFLDARQEQAARSLEQGESVEPPATWDRIRVEVLNAGGVTGMAGRARDHLRGRGFDVVHFGNAPSFDRDETVVLARTGSLSAARAVADQLGVARFDVEDDSTRFVDVTVLLGTDWVDGPPGDGLPAEAEAPADEGDEDPWWDLLRYLHPDETAGRP